MRYVDELQIISPEVLPFEHDAEVEEELHKDTFALPRNVAYLLSFSYEEARGRTNRRGVAVTIDDIRKAYRSPKYLALRTDVETRWQQLARNSCIHKDLWNPFHVPGEFFWVDRKGASRPDGERTARRPEAPNLPVANSPDSFEAQVNDALIAAAARPTGSPAEGSKKPVRSPGSKRRQYAPASNADLLAGARAFEDP
jgi:hypothetical protein